MVLFIDFNQQNRLKINIFYVFFQKNAALIIDKQAVP